MRNLSVWLFLCIMFSGIAQQNTAESLLAKLKAHNKQDTVRVNLINSYNAVVVFTAPDATLMVRAKEALALSQKLHFVKGELQATEMIAIYHLYFLNDPKEAQKHYHYIQDHMTQVTDAKIKKGFEENTPYNIGTIYFGNGDYDLALEFFNKALANYKAHGKSPDPKIYNGIGNCYFRLNENENALLSFEKSIAGARVAKQFDTEANSLSAMGYTLLEMHRVDEAFRATQKSIEIGEKNNAGLILGVIYGNHAMVLLAKSQFDEAETYARKALEINKNLGNQLLEKDALGVMARVAAKKGHYKEAFESLDRHNILSDSLSDEDKRLELSRHQMKYEKEKALALAAAKLKRQQIITNGLILIGGVVALAALLLFISYRKRQIAIAKRRKSENELHVRALQINPHFFSNALLSIARYITENNIPKAEKYLLDFSHHMRRIFVNADKKEVALSDELEMLRNYVELEKARVDQPFGFEITIADGIDPSEIKIPSLILQPFVENSIWHGIPTVRDGKITIHISEEPNDMIKYVIDDNGIGITKSNAENKLVRSTQVTQERIRLINEIYKINSSVRLIEKEIGTRIELLLPS